MPFYKARSHGPAMPRGLLLLGLPEPKSTAGLLGHQEQPGAQHSLGLQMGENNNTAATTMCLKLQNGVGAAEE